MEDATIQIKEMKFPDSEEPLETVVITHRGSFFYVQML